MRLRCWHIWRRQSRAMSASNACRKCRSNYARRDTTCGCQHNESGSQLCDEHWAWLQEWLKGPAPATPGLAEMFRKSRIARGEEPL